jgi:membrane associated rhomboid family serine protease
VNTAAEEYGSQSHIEHEWELPGWIPDKPAGCDYGYVTGGQAICCTQEELISNVARRDLSDIKFVWTPETPQPVFPEKVPLLLTAFKQRAEKGARNEIYLGAGLVVFSLVLALAFGNWELLYRNLFAVFGAVALIGGLWELSRIRKYTQADAESIAGSARFADWIKTKGHSGYTITIAACIILVGVAQAMTGDRESIQAAGLLKPAVWQGQWWRLLTYTLMHVSFMHFWMNFLALIQFARIIEQTIHRAFIPLVFLLSAVCGSVFSLLLYPHTTSVGASGGLMGLLGFMTIAVLLEQKKYPPKYLRRLIEGIIFVGLLGIIGFAFIDNAAHLGGLLGGTALGWIFLRRMSEEAAPGKVLVPLGIISLVCIGLIALTAILHMFR